jgi:hypothetical protein
MSEEIVSKGNGMAKGNDDRVIDKGQDEDGVKVTDKRLFTVDGDLRKELPEEDKREEPATPPREDKEPSGFERKPLEEPQGVDFAILINAMAQPALIFLGEVAHPGTGKAEVNLEQARLQIDLLDLLRIKCRGNLTREEEGLLDRILYDLRMLYVNRSNQPAK